MVQCVPQPHAAFRETHLPIADRVFPTTNNGEPALFDTFGQFADRAGWKTIDVLAVLDPLAYTNELASAERC